MGDGVISVDKAVIEAWGTEVNKHLASIGDQYLNICTKCENIQYVGVNAGKFRQNTEAEVKGIGLYATTSIDNFEKLVVNGAGNILGAGGSTSPISIPTPPEFSIPTLNPEQDENRSEFSVDEFTAASSEIQGFYTEIETSGKLLASTVAEMDDKGFSGDFRNKVQEAFETFIGPPVGLNIDTGADLANGFTPTPHAEGSPMMTHFAAGVENIVNMLEAQKTTAVDRDTEAATSTDTVA